MALVSPGDDSSAAPIPSDISDALARIAARLDRIGSRVVYFPCIGSTNDVAQALASSGGPEGAVVMADEQTAGRGRRGHDWFSPPGSGLYVSVVLDPARAVADPDRAMRLITMTAGLALAEGIETQTGLRADIKWPNDLLVGRRKLAGILAEGVAPDDAGPGSSRALRVVLGYGINVEEAAYPPSLRDRATSLASELGRGIDRAAVLAGTLAALSTRYRDLLDGKYDAILDGWRARAKGVAGAAVEWDTPSGVRSGITEGVDREGALLVRSGAIIERIVSGELRWGCF